MAIRWRDAAAALCACAAALALAAPAGAHTDYGTPVTNCGDAFADGGYVSGSCYDWSVTPSYTGTAYADNTSADGAEPAPPAPVTPPLPTWRSLYDWANGDGYAGWHTASSSQPGAYGLQAALGGQYGLWLWPVGGQSYSYSNGNYAEFTYTAPGTTRLSSATVIFSYRNKLLAHHCIDIGFRTGTTIVAHNEHCKPAAPPDSQRQVTVSLVDPSSNPTSKTLYIRIRVDCGGASTCSKNIPALDPLTVGGYVHVLKTDMTLVDDDKPTLQVVGDNVDTFNDTYTATIKASDAGSGVKSLQFGREGQPPFASANAPCDYTHRTDALDARLCPQDFTLSGTLDISNLEDGTYTFVATATDVAGNVGTLRWTVTISRVSLDVGLNPLTATPRDKYTFATRTDSGWTAGEKIPKASIRQGFKWRFALGPNQKLEALSNGGLAVVTTGADDNVNAFADDYSDGGAEDPSTVEPSTTVDETSDGTSDTIGPDSDPADTPDEWTPDSTSGVDPSLDVVAAADDEITDGSVDAVVQPPAATDAAGVRVSASFSISGNVATLTIVHHAAAYAYPITGSAGMVDADGNATNDAVTAAPVAGALTLQSTAATTCSVRPKVIVYGEHGWNQLLQAFEKYPLQCADYYINVTARSGDPATKRIPRAGAAMAICAANAVQAVKDANARIWPVAEFNWGAWRVWVKTHGNNTAAWRNAGMQFRRLMHKYGDYEGATCDAIGGPIPGRWSINEAPTTFTENARDSTGKIIVLATTVRAHFRAAVTGLYTGLDGFGQHPVGVDGWSYPDMRGDPFVIDAGAAKMGGFNSYRAGLRAVVKSSPFWNAMKQYVAYWGQEAYASCYKQACVPNTNRAQRAKYTNAFTLHPANFAWAARGTADAGITLAARSFFNSHYYPLLNGFWGKLVPTPTYGNTDLSTLEEMRALVSVQIYSARRHATGAPAATAGTSTAFGLYPGTRVGVAWQEEAPSNPDGSTNPDFAPNQTLAEHIARALQNAYAPGTGTAAAACSIDGVDWCAVSTADRSGTAGAAYRPKFNPCYLAFNTWALRVGCP